MTAPLDPEEVGRGIWRLPLAIPFEPAPVNCWLLDREEPILVDAGPKTDDAWAALLGHFERVGLRPGRLRHLVLTHQHVDHTGNAGRLAALAPEMRIWAHEADARGIFDHDEHMLERARAIEETVVYWGYPERNRGPALASYMYFRQFADSLDRARWAAIRGERQALALGPTRLEAIHCPGHTEGLVTLLLAEEDGGLFFANDHILERVTPNPTVYLPPYRGRRSGLGDYVRSLAAVRDLEAAAVLPGHGRPFGGLRARVDEILSHHEHRKTKIEATLARAGAAGMTILGIVHEVWPNLRPQEWYLACREVLGHLDLLIEEGRAREEAAGEDGAGRFVSR